MTAKVSSDELTFDDVSIALPPPDSQLRRVFGQPREESIPLHGGAMRTRCIVDTLGVVFYRDDTPPEVPSLFIAFSPEDTPGSPAHAFPGDVWLGGSLLLPDVTEADIRRGSSLPLTAGQRSCARRKISVERTGPASTGRRLTNSHARLAILGQFLTITRPRAKQFRLWRRSKSWNE
jgi:hypothetical protein